MKLVRFDVQESKKFCRVFDGFSDVRGVYLQGTMRVNGIMSVIFNGRQPIIEDRGERVFPMPETTLTALASPDHKLSVIERIS